MNLQIEKTALVLIDLQNGIIGRNSAPHSPEEIIERSRQLAQSFTEKGGFVVLVRVSFLDGKDSLNPTTDAPASAAMAFPDGWDVLVPELAEIKGTYTMTKRQWSAFHGTDLDLQLRRRGIDTIVLGGVSTGIGVDTTARDAFQLGYDQVFVEDIMGATDKTMHDYVCQTIFPRMGRIRSTAEVISSL
ncbi:isochorismatase family protein [Listeria grandensis]|uniref:isochorismatase family protein n=1 Tax=Listeria grandensis TaxID=1494963 RepID=UPI00164CF472|nr:isochorismatase family protein [Listeria grandensis]MBC6315075.1 isochorismatase family protein [Listeria grandensis]